MAFVEEVEDIIKEEVGGIPVGASGLIGIEGTPAAQDVADLGPEVQNVGHGPGAGLICPAGHLDLDFPLHLVHLHAVADLLRHTRNTNH